MTNLIVLDTDVLIDASRGQADALVCLSELVKHGIPAVSAVTYMELLIGCRNKDDLREVESYIAQFSLVHLDERTSLTALDLLRQYRLSHGLLLADALIAATALSLGRPLVSKNQRDYRFIEGLNLLGYPQPFAA